MFYQTFLLPKVKRSVIISNKHGMYELLLDMPQLSNLAKIRIASKVHGIVT